MAMQCASMAVNLFIKETNRNQYEIRYAQRCFRSNIRVFL